MPRTPETATTRGGRRSAPPVLRLLKRKRTEATAEQLAAGLRCAATFISAATSAQTWKVAGKQD